MKVCTLNEAGKSALIRELNQHLQPGSDTKIWCSLAELTAAGDPQGDGDEGLFLQIPSPLLRSPVMLPLNPAWFDEAEEFTVRRDNEPDLHFTGTLVASENNKLVQDGLLSGRWKKMDLYQTKAGKYVCQLIGKTTYEGETDRYSGAVCNTKAEIVAFFGYSNLAKDLYEQANIKSAQSVD